MMRALLAALALAFAVGATPAFATLEPGGPRALRAPVERAPAAFLLLAATNKPVVAKRCGSRGGSRRARSYYGYGC